jgi:oligopeptidase B
MLASAQAFSSHLVVLERQDGLPHLAIASLVKAPGNNSLFAQRIEFSEPVYNAALGANPEFVADHLRFQYESFITPRSVFDYDIRTGEQILRKQQPVLGAYDPTQYVSERVLARAPDGTTIPLSVVYRRDTPRDASAPLLLYGYGSYGISVPVSFSSNRLSLLDRGVIYAIAHVRGGGELGKPWHDAGRMHKKRNTFTDFIAAADMLTGRGWAAPDRIVSRGLSAGGLLQGAVFSMAPRRWRAVVAEVPFVDCVTTMLDPAIPLTVNEWDEWGDPRDPRIRAYMESYSPYDNVPAPPRPGLLVTGSLHDPRVLVHEPAKWVARLRATASGDGTAGDGTAGDGTAGDGAAGDAGAGDAGSGGRLLFRPELGAGAHVGPAGRYDRMRYEAEILAFILASVAAPQR